MSSLGKAEALESGEPDTDGGNAELFSKETRLMIDKALKALMEEMGVTKATASKAEGSGKNGKEEPGGEC